MARNVFPVFLDLAGRTVLVVGGGPVAVSKAQRLVEAGADVTVVSPDVVPEMSRLPVTVVQRPFQASDLDGVWYVVSAAPPDVNRLVLHEANARRVFVNAVDDPANASAFLGSSFKRGPVTVAISTGGDAPALARLMREALERLIGTDVEDWSALASGMRREWKQQGTAMESRTDALLSTLAQLHHELADRHPDATAAASAHRRRGVVSLVGAGPGDPQLLTRLAARRLAEADLVLYDALVSPAVVAIASHAQRIFVGRRKGFASTSPEAIVRTMVRAAGRGKRVVRLKGGDPFLFGRGGEEALALTAAGVTFDVVPGVSSALAAPALAGIPVTHRGLSRAVLITTGHDPDHFAAFIRGVAPDATTLVLLMATTNRQAIACALVAAGWPPSMPAAIIWNASQADAEVWTGPLEDLGDSPDSNPAPGTIVVGNVVDVREALAPHVAATYLNDRIGGTRHA